MEQKIYYLENLGCANCAAKMEAKMNALPGVEAAVVFATKQLRLRCEDPEALLPQLQRIVSGIEPDCRIRTDLPLPRGEGGAQRRERNAGGTEKNRNACQTCSSEPISGRSSCSHHHEHRHHGEHCGCQGEHHHEHHREHSHHGHCHCAHHQDDRCAASESAGIRLAQPSPQSSEGGWQRPDSDLLPGRREPDPTVSPSVKSGCEEPLLTAPSSEGAKGLRPAFKALRTDRELRGLLLGAGFFALGLLLDALGAALGSFRVGILAYVAAYLLLGTEILLTAGKHLLRGHVFDENFLMSLATLGAFVIGEFPEAVGVMLFYRVGEYFEHRAVDRSRKQIMEAIDLRPETVLQVLPQGSAEIPASEARPGDRLLVRPGDRIPLDGIVESGRSFLDTSPITGEPVPVAVGPGDRVISGCVNTQGQLILLVEKPLSESMVTRILDAVENAAAGKPRIHRFISRFARIYTPVVVAAAVITAVVPSLITGDWSYWVYTALSFLVMSCPCALVLSVPLAFFSGIGVGGKQGILFKSGLSLEALAGIKAAALDKTGTVTRGEFKLLKLEGPELLLRLAAGAEQNSQHPIAKSILEAARERGLSIPEAEALEEYPGCGIACRVEGHQVLCGNTQLLKRFGIAAKLPETADTAVAVAIDGAYAGYLLIGDSLKPEAAEAVQALKKLGIHTAMLTGDSQDSARAMAARVGIGEVHGKLLPQDKLTCLQGLRQRQGSVLFVGDGINDAPVLAGADVGAAMGSGSDAAIEAADVVYLQADVRAIPESVSLARRTRRIAWQNVVFALGVKAVVMILGLLGEASLWLAVFADSGVAMLCVLNSIRLLLKKKAPR